MMARRIASPQYRIARPCPRAPQGRGEGKGTWRAVTMQLQLQRPIRELRALQLGRGMELQRSFVECGQSDVPSFVEFRGKGRPLADGPSRWPRRDWTSLRWRTRRSWV